LKVEIFHGERGDPVLKFNGRLMASRFDPRGEAVQWVDRRLCFLDKVKTIFILGAGSGYHLGELADRSQADLIVIEPCSELIRAVEGLRRSDRSRVHFECVQTGKALRSSARVRKALTASFVVLVHAPSREGRETVFAELQAQLLGRDWGSLSWQWRLQNFAELDSRPRVSSERLTIYDLEQTELVQDSSEREKLLLKALRELVK
jgi:hypothetical protein